jgi:hypothetical protein
VVHARIGVSDDAGGSAGGAVLDVAGVGEISLTELAAAHQGTLPRYFG